MQTTYVTNRHGQRVPFDETRIRRALEAATRGYEKFVDTEKVVAEFRVNLYDGMSTTEINKTLIMVLVSRMEEVPEFGQVAARVLLNELSKDMFDRISSDADYDAVYRSSFAEKIRKGVEDNRLDPKLLMYDFNRLMLAMKPERDGLFTYMGTSTLKGRYLMKLSNQEIIEMPQYFWMRVAMGLALNEENRMEKVIEFYETLSQLRYVASTPTLFHSGTTHPQMSSCYINTVEDDLDHIFKVVGDNAQLAKWSGGIGSDWTGLRGTGARIQSTNVNSQGVIPFLKIVDSATAAINRSGKRRGATCVYLETWHYDIESFLELRKNTGDERRRTHDTNTANWIPDLFMKRVIEDGEWTLFSPDETPDLHLIYGAEFEKRYVEYEQAADRGEIRLFKRVKASELWRKMLTMLFSTGHPWITFKDPCNVRSPQDHVGVVRSSNLCTEITLNTSRDETAVCNLGSVNLSRHIEAGALNKDLLKQTVLTAMRMLDNVIDLNFYPTKEARNSNMRHRPVGLGIMGVQDALLLQDMKFDSEEAVKFSDETQEFVSYYAILGSSMLAKEKGTYKSYRGSKWDRGLLPIDTIELLEQERGMKTEMDKTMSMNWTEVRDHIRRYGMRNSNTMAIAPTATIANISGCFPTTEPMYKNMYVKSNQAGEYTVINHYLVAELRQLNLWTPQIIEKIKYNDGSALGIEEIPYEIQQRHKGVFEIEPVWVIRHASARAKWLDQSQSINLFAESTSGQFFSEMYIMAWKYGLKTTYYLRTLGASQVDRATLDDKSQQKQDGGSTAPAQSPVATAAAAPSPAPVPAAPVTPMPMPAPQPVAESVPAAQQVVQPVTTAEPVMQSAPASTAPLAAQAMYATSPPPAQMASVPVETAPNPQPTAAPVSPAPAVNQGPPKLCRIEDPTCESCQ